MKKGRQITGVRRQQGTVRARFPAAMLFLLLACLCGVLYAADFKLTLPSAVLPAGETVGKEVYGNWAVSLGVVKIVCGDFRGSGVVIAQDEDGLVIVSAKHLLMYDAYAVVSFAGTDGGRNGQDQADAVSVIGYSASYDLAYLYVPFSILPTDVAKYYENMRSGNENAGVGGGHTAMPKDAAEEGADRSWVFVERGNGRCAAVRTEDAYREIRAGEPVVQVGLSEDAGPEYYMGTVQAKEVFISDYNASMLLNACDARQGMSGGGAFDESGRLVGIIIAGDEQGTVCMPMTTVLAEYWGLMEERD